MIGIAGVVREKTGGIGEIWWRENMVENTSHALSGWIIDKSEFKREMIANGRRG